MKSTTAVCTKHHSNAMIMARKLLGIASSKSDQDTHYNSNSSFKKEEVDDVLSLNTTPTNDPIITTNDLRSSTKFKTTTSQQQQQQKQEQMTKNPNEPKIAVFFPSQPFVRRECKYVAKTSQVINAQVSFGSQLQ